MQVAATLTKSSKESQDWDARAAQEVAAALARGANVGALVEKKQQRADFLRSKAERTQSQAAQAEVPSQHLCAFPDLALAFSCGFYRERERASSMAFRDREDVTAARGVCLATAAGVDDLGKPSTAAFPTYPFSAVAETQAASAG